MVFLIFLVVALYVLGGILSLKFFNLALVAGRELEPESLDKIEKLSSNPESKWCVFICWPWIAVACPMTKYEDASAV